MSWEEFMRAFVLVGVCVWLGYVLIYFINEP